MAFESVIVFNTTSDQHAIWEGLEIFYTSILTLEFLVRIVTWQRTYVQYFTDPFNWFDFFGILPYFFQLAFKNKSLKAIRVLRLLRISQLLRFAAQSSKIRLIFEALQKSLDGIYLYIIFSLLSMIIWSSMIYYAEGASCVLNSELTVSLSSIA